jgi:hypothetical protein
MRFQGMRTGVSFQLSPNDRKRVQATFVWKVDPDKIIAAATRGRQALKLIHLPARKRLISQTL